MHAITLHVIFLFMGTLGTVQIIQIYIPCIRSNYDVLLLNNEPTII